MARKRQRIYKRLTKKGAARYDVSFEFYDAQGRRKPFMRTFMTEKEALHALAEHEAKRGRGQEVRPQQATFAQLVAEWSVAQEAKVRVTTFAQQQCVLRHHVLPELGPVLVAKITLRRLEAHYRDLAARGVGSGLVHHVHQLCRQILRWAVLRDYAIDAGALQVPGPKYRSREMTCWDDEQIARFLAVCDASDYGPIWRVAVYTGMRRGELMGLRWRDIDWEGRNIHVRESRCFVGNTLVIGPTKSGKPRTISVPEVLLERLRAHRTRQLRERLRWGERWVDPELVFTNYRGGTIAPGSLRSNLAHLLERAGLQPIRIHDLRHTYASCLFRQGRTVSEVAARLGHADAAQTLNVYSHLIPDQHRATADLLGQLFG